MGNKQLNKIILALITLLILSACSDPFDNAMRKGKDALIDKDYEDAVKYFEIATIENPSNENAQTLLLKSHIEMDNYKKEIEFKSNITAAKNEIDRYLAANKNNYDTIESILRNYDARNEGLFYILEYKKEIANVYQNQKEIISRFSQYDVIVNAHNDFYQSVSYLIDYLDDEEARKLKEDYTLYSGKKRLSKNSLEKYDESIKQLIK